MVLFHAVVSFQEEDQREVIKGNPKFRVHPRPATIIDMPVMKMLDYCCFYHYDLPEVWAYNLSTKHYSCVPIESMY